MIFKYKYFLAGVLFVSLLSETQAMEDPNENDIRPVIRPHNEDGMLNEDGIRAVINQ
jgi:hypothetical protein